MYVMMKIIFVLTSVFGTTIGYTIVEKLTVKGNYKSDCSVDVTCYIETSDLLAHVSWVCYGGPPNVIDIAKIPGFTVGPLMNPALGQVQQTISIRKCYSKLELECSTGSSSKKVVLHSGIGISVNAIIGIVFGVLSVTCGLGGYFVSRRKRMANAAARLQASGNATQCPPPPPNSYPTQPAPIYSQGTTDVYPQEGAPSYPQQPGPFYPQQQPLIYPPYPSQPNTAHPEKASELYPNQPVHEGGQVQPLLQNPPPYSWQEPPAPSYK